MSSLVFNPDGAVLVSGGTDGWIKLWDTANPGVLLASKPVKAAAKALAYSPNDRFLAVGLRYRTYVYNIAYEDWKDLRGPEEPYLKTCKRWGARRGDRTNGVRQATGFRDRYR